MKLSPNRRYSPLAVRYFNKLELPEVPYRPGSGMETPRIEVEGGDAALERASFRRHPGLPAGIDLFNRGWFWEAHEVWEAGWRASDGCERELLQGLIQLAASRLQGELGNHDGAARVLERARGHLASAREAGPILCGIDIDELETSPATIIWRIRGRDLPGTFTDIAVQPPDCELALAEVGIVQTTPTRDDYYSGNSIFLDAPIDPSDPDELARWKQICAEEITVPALFHNLQWELEGSVVGDEPQLEGLERFVVLRASRLNRAVPCPENVSIRPLESDADWAAAANLSIELNLPDWGEGAIAFTRWRYAGFRKTVEVFGGAFFGAFIGSELCACLGTVAVGSSFRYQDVQTRVAYRRRGLATAMCAAAFEHMRNQGAAAGVIVADAGSIAETIYRGLGFELVSTTQTLQIKLDAE